MANTLDEQLAYWLRRSAEVPARLELPTDYPQPVEPSGRAAHVTMTWARDLHSRLVELACREGATLYVVLLAAFQVLLAKWAATPEVVVHTPAPRRTRREAEGSIESFANTVVLRTTLSGDPTFSEVLRRVRTVTLDAFERQDLSFENPVDVLFTLDTENGELDSPASGGRSPRAAVAGSECDLALEVYATAARFTGTFSYRPDVFAPETIARMLTQLTRVLEQVAAAADRRLSDLTLLDASERQQIVETWNETAVAHATPQCVHDLVEVQAARTPDAVAIVSDSTTLTYAELNARANQLAHHLRRLSVGPEARVAICLDRGAHLVMALLAVLKANGAFVPLDPTYPAERLAWMLADSNACVLVTDATMRAHVPVRGDLVVVDLDDRAVLLAAESVTNPTSNVGPAHAAYVIYTSGSTGQPHAVVVPHGGVTNLMMTPPTLFGIEATSRVLQWASASFDAAVWEVFRTLTVGATLLAPSRYAVLPGATLVETLRRAQVSVALFPPSVLAFTDAQELPALLTVVSAGEALTTDVAARWSDGRTVINAYGPTETTVCATLGVYGREPGAPPIGRPLANVRVYVLDADGQPVPVGLAGELYIGGVGVARGYLHHPGLTAARFVPDPFAAVSGRLYRTGDRVRWRADGVLEYLGRLDAQVKIRGHRIEPGEIETVLARQRGVREARVVVREDTPGHKRLVAYVVGDAVGNTLRAQLQNHLPGYMVPAAVVVLSRLPLTVNGKLDVRALPRPASDDSDSKIEQPKSFVEAQLIHIWEELLGVEVRTPTQSFFDLGGDSFLAVQLLERIKQRLHCDLPVTTLFTGATVRQMANAIAKRQQSGPHAPSPVALLQPSGSHPPLFCVHAASGKAIVYIDLVRHLGADRPIFGLEDLGDPSRPVTQVASEYVDAIQSVRPDGPYYLAGWSFGGVVAYEMASLLERQGHTISFVGLIDTWEPALEQRMATDEVDVLIGLGRELAHLARQEFSIARADLEPLDEEQRISRLLSALHARGILLRAGPKAIRDLYELPRARAASTRGCTLGQLSAVVTLFRTTKNNRVDLEPIFAGLEAGEKWTLGWSRVSSRVNVHTVAGEHDTMCQEPYVRVLAQRMRQVLAEADHRVTA